MTGSSGRSYVPAAGKHWRLPFYDLIAKLLGGDAARMEFARQADCRPGHRVLEIGCGTGSLLVALKRAQRGAEVVGLDPDPGALAIARRKAKRAGAEVRLDQGFADELPYPDASFDRVLSSFMFHHLSREVKEDTLREVVRVLRPGGRFHLVDFAGPASGDRGFIARHLHTSQHLRDNDEHRVLGFLRNAGLAEPAVVGRRASHLGGMVYYAGASPSPETTPVDAG